LFCLFKKDTIKVVQKEEDKIKYDQMINSLNEAKNNNIDYKIFSNISDSLKWLTTRNREEEINVLITGSLYLVGLSLKLLDHKID
jgi:folylpolyglutamate synthase/dihydropteroate synthase